MTKIINKAKDSVSRIHWPSFKELVRDTTFTVVVGSALALLISLWTSAIEIVVDWVMKLF